MLQCAKCEPTHLKDPRQKRVWGIWKEQLTGQRCSGCGRRGGARDHRVHPGDAHRAMAERAIAAVQPDLRAPAFADDLPVPDEVERAALNISRRRATASRTHGAPLRLAFDLDGVLADMESELMRQAKCLFGSPGAQEPAEGATL